MFHRLIGTVKALTSSTVGLIVFSLAAGVIIAMVFVIIQQYAVGDFVRKLRGCGAVSRETAITASEAGIKRNPAVIISLRMSESALRRVVFPVEEAAEAQENENKAEVSDRKVSMSKKRKNKKEKIALKSTRWYIPEEKLQKAEALFGMRRINPVLLVISVVLLLTLMYYLIPFIPNLIEFAGALLSA